MKHIFACVLLFLCLNASAATYYVSTSGSNSYPGTFSQPFATIQYGVDHLTSPGDILYIRGGTYTPSSTVGNSWYNAVYISPTYSGTSGNTIKVYNYPNETVIISGAGLTENGVHVGVLVNGVSYWEFKGINVTSVTEYGSGSQLGQGVWMNSASNITFERCSVSNSAHGFFIYRGTGNQFINCDGHDNTNLGNGDPGGYADGFVCNLQSGVNTILFEGCRAWNNSDDGFDSYGSSGYVTWNNCWSFHNGYDILFNGQHNGNGAGFKLGANEFSLEDQPQRMVTNCLSWSNALVGFDKSNDPPNPEMTVHFYNNVSYNNGEDHGYHDGSSFNFFHSTVADIMRNNISFDNYGFYTLGDGSMVIDHNNFIRTSETGSFTVTSADFISVDPTGTDGARNSDGSLPNRNFLKIKTSSSNAIANIIGKGQFVNMSSSPSLGVDWAYLSGTSASVTTASTSNIATTSATSGGNVTSDGGYSVTAKGICWSTTSSPTIALSTKTNDGTGTGAFVSYMTSLSPGTTYYVRAYATNSQGTSYGSQVTFQTLSTNPSQIKPILHNNKVVYYNGKIVIL
jgi:parallel beta-helix repeat protein